MVPNLNKHAALTGRNDGTRGSGHHLPCDVSRHGILEKLNQQAQLRDERNANNLIILFTYLVEEELTILLLFQE